ncbi:hypothetical protein ABK040_009126 [Willaertia magna]
MSKCLTLVMEDVIHWFQTCFHGKKNNLIEIQPNFKVPISESFTINIEELNNNKQIILHKLFHKTSSWKNFVALPKFIEKEETLVIYLETIKEKVIPLMKDNLFAFLFPLNENSEQLIKMIKENLIIEKNARWVREDTFGMILTKERFLTLNETNQMPTVLSKIQLLTGMEDNLDELIEKYLRNYKASYGDGEPSEMDFKLYKNINFLISSTEDSFIERLMAYDVNNQVIGCCGLCYNKKTKRAFLHDVTISKKYRNQGIASYLTMTMILRAFNNYEMEEITLTAVGKAKDLYEKRFKFEHVGIVTYFTKIKAFQ